MEELDGDEVRVSSRGRVAERDIVQVQYSLYDVVVIMGFFYLKEVQAYSVNQMLGVDEGICLKD